jgi:Ca2+-binding RTX toxin-like protein
VIAASVFRPEVDGKYQEIDSDPQTTSASARRRRQTAIGGALAIALLTVGATPAAASPAAKASVVDGTLSIAGSPLAERITLRLSALDPNRLEVDFGDDGSADSVFDIATFRDIEVAAGNGDDTVRIDQVNGAFTTTEATRIHGGNGDDSLLGGSGAESFFGGNGDDFVDGNGGADTAFLGRGDDVFVWDPGDASDVVEGDNGSDTLVFNGAAGNEIMTTSADGGRVRLTRSPGNIVMDLDGVELIDARALGGADAVTVNDVAGTDLERVDVDLAAALGGANGDVAADTVTVAGTNDDDSVAVDANGAAVQVSGLAATVRVTHADPTSDTLVIDTGAGVDDVVLDPALGGLILVSVL